MRTTTGLPLVTDERLLGLTRVEVPTGAGLVVARVRPGPGSTGVVLIHGAAGSWTTWTPLLQAAAAAGRPLGAVVAVDLPGWGESPAPRTPLDAARAARMVAEVARAAGFERWTVIGHSLGGFVALRLAGLEPVATEGVVLVSPSGPAVVRAVQRPVLGGLRLPWFAGMRVAMRVLGAMPREGRALLALLDRTGVLTRLSAPLFADPRSVHASVPAALAAEIRPRAFTAATVEATVADLSEWSLVRCPVRSVRGRHDVFVGRHDAEELGALLADFAETAVPDAGHFAAVERPDAVLAALDAVRRE